jgi:hypothetical protein
MAIVLKKPFFGNLALYDIRSVVNVKHLRPDFNRLGIDPQSHQGKDNRANMLKVQKNGNNTK